tara:strand:+ start:560 stop:1129 length:570 start_codon:yes stop_codon:yes gene_type:complete
MNIIDKILQYKFHRTTPVIILCVLIVILLSILSTEIRADELVHKFKSPSFSGISTSSHYLTIENQEKSRRDAIQKDIESAILAAQREAENTTMAKFMRNLESRIYSQLSKQLVESLFKQCDLTVDPACVQATFGSFALEGNTISYQKTACDTTTMEGCVLGEEVIILTIIDEDGTETIITIPIGNGTFG